MLLRRLVLLNDALAALCSGHTPLGSRSFQAAVETFYQAIALVLRNSEVTLPKKFCSGVASSLKSVGLLAMTISVPDSLAAS